MRRLLSVLCLAFVVSMSWGNVASAADAGSKAAGSKAAGSKTEKGNSQSVRQRLLKRFDKDGDGKLSDQERQAAREEMQKKRGGAKPGLNKLKGRSGKFGKK